MISDGEAVSVFNSEGIDPNRLSYTCFKWVYLIIFASFSLCLLQLPKYSISLGLSTIYFVPLLVLILDYPCICYFNSYYRYSYLASSFIVSSSSLRKSMLFYLSILEAILKKLLCTLERSSGVELFELSMIIGGGEIANL